jgi:hypothetical protein
VAITIRLARACSCKSRVWLARPLTWISSSPVARRITQGAIGTAGRLAAVQRAEGCHRLGVEQPAQAMQVVGVGHGTIVRREAPYNIARGR